MADLRRRAHGWRLWAVLGGAVIVIAVIAKLAPVSLPLLLLLACPLSMMFMMSGMGHAHGSDPHVVDASPQIPLPSLESLPYDDQVRLLRTRLLSLHAEREVVADMLDRLEGRTPTTSEDADGHAAWHGLLDVGRSSAGRDVAHEASVERACDATSI